MTDLERRAAEAWAMMVDAGMPAGVALDYVQEVDDDRDRCADALRCAAANALQSSLPPEPPEAYYPLPHPTRERGEKLVRYLRAGMYLLAGPIAKDLRRGSDWALKQFNLVTMDAVYDAVWAWDVWARVAARAVELVRDISNAE